MAAYPLERGFVDRERELRALERFWSAPAAQCVPITGRRRVGKTFLLERFAAPRFHVYYRCQLRATVQQLPLLGAVLAQAADDPVLRADPPSTWPALFALIERLARERRFLLVLDELPYWVARDESLPSLLQNWWDERGRHLNLMLVLCGSAVQMMERLLTGDAPLAGCVTERLIVRPFDLRAAAALLDFADPIDAVAAYGILGGVPLYLSFMQPDLSIRENLLENVISPTSRLYVEPQAVFAAHHEAYNAPQALSVLRAITRGHQRWSDIVNTTGLTAVQLSRIMEPLTGDLSLVERVLPVTERHETKAYRTQYQLSDNFFRFWFRFIEPAQGQIEFGDADGVVDGILATLPEFLGLPFESVCREWIGQASAAGILPERLTAVGSWWNPQHQVDVVGLDAERQVAVTGECKWRNQGFTWADLETYLGHVQALAGAAPVRPDLTHLLFSKAGFDARVQTWAANSRARLITPSDLLTLPQRGAAQSDV
ncbi:MAG: ATP-binding protein [Chloroflexi bacterium]|nr:ATP-binding protein [Chloroflexota bacterium]